MNILIIEYAYFSIYLMNMVLFSFFLLKNVSKINYFKDAVTLIITSSTPPQYEQFKNDATGS